MEGMSVQASAVAVQIHLGKKKKHQCLHLLNCSLRKHFFFFLLLSSTAYKTQLACQMRKNE